MLRGREFIFSLLDTILEDVVGQQVLPHDIFGKIVVYISPYGMYVVGPVLSIVEFHYEISSVNSVVMFTTSISSPTPSKMNIA